MATTNNLTEFLTGVADAIRAKKSTTALINPQDFAAEIASISGGGGGDEPQPEGTHKVLFVDVDGTVLKTEYVADGGSATPPANPTRTYCTFVEWVGDYTNVTEDVAILTRYQSSDGYTHYEIDAQAGDFVTLFVYNDIVQHCYIDWGDGETSEVGTYSQSTLTHWYTTDVKGFINVTQGTGKANTQIYGGTCWTGIVESRLGEISYRGLPKLKYIVLPPTGTKLGYQTFNGDVSLVCIVLPDGITSIPDSAFSSCTSLRYANLPPALTSISGSFPSCSQLQEVVIPDTVTSLGGYAYRNCYTMRKLRIGSGIGTINQYTFNGCKSLRSIKFTEGLTALADDAFSGCSSLISLNLPSTLTSIGSSFNTCASLRRVTLPEGLTTIGSYAFYKCSGLLLVDVPSTVTSIGTYAYGSCNSLQTFICRATTPPTLGSEAIISSVLTGIYVPDDSVDTYKAATNWSAYASKILPLSEYTE